MSPKWRFPPGSNKKEILKGSGEYSYGKDSTERSLLQDYQLFMGVSVVFIITTELILLVRLLNVQEQEDTNSK